MRGLFPILKINSHARVPSYVVMDTPGQIEIFTWSASGAIITDAVASALPTVIAYIVDTPRAVAPATFMSNMLYACRYVVFAPPFLFRVVSLCAAVH